MDLVGHQHIGVEAAAMTFLRLGQAGEEKPIVGVGEEDRLAVIAALDDMVGKRWDGAAGAAGHDRNSP